MATIMAHQLQHFKTNFIGRIYYQNNKNSKRGLISYSTSLEMQIQSEPLTPVHTILSAGPPGHGYTNQQGTKIFPERVCVL